MSAAAITPSIAARVRTRVRNTRKVHQALVDNRWVLDDASEWQEREAQESILLWMVIARVNRNLGAEDEFSWPWCRSGSYSARSTYRMISQGRTRFQLAQPIWRSLATPKSKLFIWLAVQHRIWTADRRFRHGLQE